MRPAEPLPLNHSWPLVEQGLRLDLGRLWDGPLGMAFSGGPAAIGEWACDLGDESLTWSPAVHDLFGLPRNARPVRAETVALYREPSRAAMERLRAHAIRHRRGFTLDVEIGPGSGRWRWVRLIAAPIVAGGAVVGLRGFKLDVSAAYR